MAQFVDFIVGMFGTRAIEIIAVLCGLVNVGLIIRRSIWNYPFGILMVILYAWIFYDVRLYSDALLQIFFLFIQVIGIFTWLNARDDDGLVKPTDLPLRAAAVWVVAAIIASFALGHVMATRTDADFPYWDATTTVLSVIAQYLMARRYLQSWLVWITVDVLAIGLYWQKDLTPTAALYLIFLGMAVTGYLNWRQSMQPSKAAYA
ncbi:nicotinamide mononucleotide transporter [Paracoccus caeni]|uniref:Nicotinamide riboside transporter PnuC n=1 Tax=Paracoccus caeni TaxID=657651 RepID=A0A934SN55_9RHOB|nr:nicotinamide riboside transporter PnuC [Paracoccus caeni]MBK4218164.1 nicotinamide mononucleotide transporter [Paracoccus caeni]